MQWCNRKQDRLLSASYDIDESDVTFSRALNTHLYLLELHEEIWCKNRLEISFCSRTTQVHLVSAHYDWDFVIDFGNTGQPVSLESLDDVEIVHVVYQDNHVRLFNFTVSLLFFSLTIT